MRTELKLAHPNTQSDSNFRRHFPLATEEFQAVNLSGNLGSHFWKPS